MIPMRPTNARGGGGFNYYYFGKYGTARRGIVFFFLRGFKGSQVSQKVTECGEKKLVKTIRLADTGRSEVL